MSEEKFDMAFGDFHIHCKKAAHLRVYVDPKRETASIGMGVSSAYMISVWLPLLDMIRLRDMLIESFPLPAIAIQESAIDSIADHLIIKRAAVIMETQARPENCVDSSAM